MSNLMAARMQMAYSLGFHMIFAALGVGMPLLMFIAQGLGLKTGKKTYFNLARTWAKATGILFVIGAVSGTALSFELGLLWPPFMEFGGSTMGPAFTLEGYAFFTEAIFIGLFLYGWERLKPVVHWLCGLVVAISGAASSVLVVAADAWMQNPVGADLLMTNPEALNPATALFGNPAWAMMAIHSTIACYSATGFAVAGVYAWGVLRGRNDELRRNALAISMGMALIAAFILPITGHASAVDIATRQPYKLAAAEAHFHTHSGASLIIGGIPDAETQTVRWALEIPYGLSILAFNDPHAEVAGLDQIPREEWPNVLVNHIAFQTMVGAGTLTLIVAVLYWWYYRKKQETRLRWLMWAILVCSPLGFIALEAGWVVTEVGRQPWIIYNVMRTADAVTPAPGVITTFVGFVVLYAFLGLVLVTLLRRLKHDREEAVRANDAGR